MSALAWGAAWVIAAAGTAMLPLRRQRVPGGLLLLAAPALMVWIAVAAGWVWVVPALLAFGSMFRRPLGHLVRRARGRPSPSFDDMVAAEEGRS